MNSKEQGAASIIVTMEDGKLKVTHGQSTWAVLHERDADAGIWDAIWDVIKNYQTDEPIKVWTYFVGDEIEVWNFVTEWSGILEREVNYYIPNANDTDLGEKSWYCETMATKKQIFDYDMDSDWMTERN
jgi:hypothetical protein